MRKRWKVLILLLIWAGGAVWWFRGPLETKLRAAMSGLELRTPLKPQPDPEKYATLKKDLERWRKDLAGRHAKAADAKERAVVEADARIILERALPAMMRCWLGTKYDFNGTADGPGNGKIACGYFVATVLKDAGFKVDRYQLARQASENILRTFLPKEVCILTVDQDYQKFAADVAKREPGVYIVGLDTHVAFIVVRDGEFRFIHASGSKPWCVVEENAEEAGVLRRSSWRMLGNLTQESRVIRQWLKATRVSVKGA
ncbi:MAG: hypothetical protein V4640_15725 [Verrucomicrobiota bacterium]